MIKIKGRNAICRSHRTSWWFNSITWSHSDGENGITSGCSETWADIIAGSFEGYVIDGVLIRIQICLMDDYTTNTNGCDFCPPLLKQFSN